MATPEGPADRETAPPAGYADPAQDDGYADRAQDDGYADPAQDGYATRGWTATRPRRLARTSPVATRALAGRNPAPAAPPRAGPPRRLRRRRPRAGDPAVRATAPAAAEAHAAAWSGLERRSTWSAAGSARAGRPKRPCATAIGARSGAAGHGAVRRSASLGESDELFRAWQGSVREAAGHRTRGSGRRPAGQAARRRRAWQVARIGVPAAVIVTVGAGALMMLTGRANEMLAERSSTGPLTSAAPGSPRARHREHGRWCHADRVPGRARRGRGRRDVVGRRHHHGRRLRERPPGGLAARRAAARWSLVSATVLGGLTGHLTSVAHGSAGWIAVGSVIERRDGRSRWPSGRPTA